MRPSFFRGISIINVYDFLGGYMNQSPTIGKLAEALSQAQSQIEGARKDSKNPFFKSSYADLESVWNACRKQLCENGLSVIQTTEGTPDAISLVTTLVHVSGEWIRGVLPICPVKSDPQSIGSALTYARRYALAAIAGVCQTDDDAEESMRPTREIKSSSPIIHPANRAEMISQEQLKELGGYVVDDSDAGNLLRSRFKISDLSHIRRDEFDKVINWVKQRKEERLNGKSRVAAMA